MLHRLLFALTFLLLAAFVLAGCEREVAPPLIVVAELSPREVELGDHLELKGAGFPQGRAGRIKLEGSLYRAGERPIRGVKIEAEGVVTSPDRLEIVIREPLVEQFCGHGDHASHATFRGDVEVAFASSQPGAPPLLGVSRGVSLDVRPLSVRASVTDARAAEGARVLTFLGVVTGPATPRGLPVEQVTEASPAHRAGIEVGDVLVAVDGVHALEVADVAPLSARETEITVRHAESGIEEIKTMPLATYASERVPTELAPALVLVGLALAALVVLVMPGPPGLSVLELRLASRLRRARRGDLARALFGEGRHAAVSVIASATIATLALGPHLVAPDLDGVLLLVVAVSLLVASRVASTKGLVEALRVLFHVSVPAVVVMGSLAVVVLHVGALELREIVRAQGPWPWEAAAAKHPGPAVLAFAYAAALVAILRVRHGAASETRPLPSTLERVGVLFAAALGVLAFFGGWQVPGLGEARSAFGSLLGAAIFVGKTWIVAAALWGAARIGASWRPLDARAFALKRLLPAIGVAAALVIASRRLAPSVALETACAATLLAVVVLVTLRTFARVRAALARPEPHASPFL